MRRKRWKRVVGIVILFAVGLLVVIQFAPYGRRHSNPPVAAEPAWDQPATRALAVRACYDCHSNQTRWPWYSHVAPFSWLVQWDVDEGRQALNFSQWNLPQEEAGEAADTVLAREMPPARYLLLHPEARLSASERDRLARGLTATVGSADERD
jgi:hypothetical protein